MTTTAPYPVTAAAGLPETVLPDGLLARLPESVAAPPWRTRCHVVTWLHSAGPAALEAFPAAIRPERLALVAWALVRYEETPVGPYSEVAATLIPDGGDGYGHIPFIVVDSLPSIVGGRANWLLPKALARFAWTDGGREVTVTSDEPATPAWSISAGFSATEPPSVVTIPNLVQQVSVEGVVRRFGGELTGSMRAGTVTVDGHADGPLAALLAPGSYSATGMRDCEFTVGPLDPV
jgi:Acetoacetate decarboxylase (ADC)